MSVSPDLKMAYARYQTAIAKLKEIEGRQNGTNVETIKMYERIRDMNEIILERSGISMQTIKSAYNLNANTAASRRRSYSLAPGSETQIPKPGINTPAAPTTTQMPFIPMHHTQHLSKKPVPERSTLAKVCSGLTCGLSNYVFGKPKTEGGKRRTYKKKNKESKKSKKRQSRKI